MEPLVTVHDENILEVPEGFGQGARDVLVELMELAAPEGLKVPLVAEGKCMSRWQK
jgi:DNA polymerase I-like protein with 3'-5' exonuclease and polymerase domains